ncbi:patatin-like phospholipase family protein [Paenibacillus sp. N1-5-1-14]|uniref:patatin-like phospholipase family protein n=1 Tax=Paenibacillus radicibacter TaxID=2972488 RepID=UPI0021594651|nr:patatin-like phospholipase family protein [Paenibacillus radicibacter]MCR8644199.1 patatin-like phospholipase family protein [Paenibacillus radicibacter]
MIRIGIAFGGGGIAGSAHLGVLAALEEANIPIHCMAGTSCGALVAGLYACGYTSGQLMDMVPEFTDKYLDYNYRSMFAKVVRRPVKLQGLIKGKKFRDYLLLKTQERLVRDLSYPIALVAADLRKAQKVLFHSASLHSNGNGEVDYEQISDVLVGDAILASCSIPFLFPPVTLGERVLVDGGLLDNCPISTVRALGADFVIAVDLCCDDELTTPLNSLYEIVSRSVSVNLIQQSKQLSGYADVLLRPNMGMVSAFDFNKGKSCIELGYLYTLQKIHDIHLKIEQKNEQHATINFPSFLEEVEPSDKLSGHLLQ